MADKIGIRRVAIDERRHPHPVGHRAGRPARRRAAAAAGLRRAAPAGGRRSWRRRSPARRSRPRPWSTRRTCGWWTPTRPSTGTAAATSSPPPPRPCGASSSNRPAASAAASAAAGTGARRPRRSIDAGRWTAADDDLLALDEALDQLAARRPGRRRAGQAPLLRRPDRWSEAAERPGHLAATADRDWAFARAWLLRRAADGDARLARSPGAMLAENPGTCSSWTEWQHRDQCGAMAMTRFADAVEAMSRRPDASSSLGRACGLRSPAASRRAYLDRRLRQVGRVLRPQRRGRPRCRPRRRGRPELAEAATPDGRCRLAAARPGTRHRPVQAAGADRRRRHGHRSSWPSRPQPVRRRVAAQDHQAGHGLPPGHRPLRGGAAGAGPDGPPEHRQGPRRRHDRRAAGPTS